MSRAPSDEIRSRERNLSEQEVGFVLPSWYRPQAGCHSNPEPFADIWVVGELPGFSDHGADCEIVRSSTGLWAVSVNEEELIDAIRRCRQEIPVEAQHVAIAGIDTGDGAASHELDLVGYGNARDRRSADVIVGDQECTGDRTQDANLMADMLQIGPCGWFDFAKNLERPGHRQYATSGQRLCAPERGTWVRTRPSGLAAMQRISLLGVSGRGLDGRWSSTSAECGR